MSLLLYRRIVTGVLAGTGNCHAAAKYFAPCRDILPKLSTDHAQNGMKRTQRFKCNLQDVEMKKGRTGGWAGVVGAVFSHG